MKPDDSPDMFRRFLREASGRAVESLNPAEGVDALLSFYVALPGEGLAPSGGDALLFQWGSYDWGSGEHFEFDITRQFMGPSGEDDAISQLSLTFQFEPSDVLRELGKGNQWCWARDERTRFHVYIISHPAYAAVAQRRDARVRLRYEYV